MMASADSGRPIDAGALYTVGERLETFRVPYCHWPFDSGPCTPLKMAEAGFYFCGTESSPDWVRCITCHHNMEGWEAEDCPLDEHKRHSKDCPFLKIKNPYTITVGDILNLEKKAMEYYIKMESRKLEQELNAIAAGLKGKLVEAVETFQSKNKT